jgi:hypothetical protein
MSCLKKFFPALTTFDDGRTKSLSFDRSFGGSFVGAKGNKLITVRTETNTYTSAYIGQLFAAPGMNVGDGRPQSGGTFSYNPKRNFVASDVASNPLNKDIGVFGLFVHEVANSIGDQYDLADPYGGYGKQNAKHGIADPDVGAAFETCVFGGLVGLRTGRVGSHREFR